MRVQIVGPRLDVPGGVSNFFNVMLPRLRSRENSDIAYVEVGSGFHKSAFVRLVEDQRRVREALQANRPELVHLNPSLGYKSFFRDALLIRSAKLSGAKVLVFFHGWSEGFARWVEGPLKIVFSKTYGQADGFVVLAGAFERRLRSWGITQPTYRCFTAVDDEIVEQKSLTSWPNESSVASARKTVKILFMSRLEEKKGVLETVQAVDRLIASGYEVCLTIAGSGPCESKIREFLKRRSNTNRNVHLVGHVEEGEKIRHLSSHDIFCLPTSYGEGLPTAVVEAMAFGMAVITSPAGGLADFFDGDRMGALVPGCDVDTLTQAIAELVSSPNNRAAKGLFNSIYARDNFYASSVAKRLSDIYGELMAGSRWQQS